MSSDQAAALLDRTEQQVRKLIRERPWPEVGAMLADTYLTLSHDRSTEAEAATWAADLIPVLRPLGWAEAPRGEELAQAVLEAYRARLSQSSISSKLQP